MWVKNTDASPSGIAMLVKGTGGPFSGSAYQLWIDNSDGRTKFTVGNGASAQTVTDTNITNPFGSAGNWHFIVVWHDSVANQIGISVDTDTYTASWSSGTQDDSNGLTLGGDPNWAPDWKGAMDEVGFWKRTLTSTERTYLYNSGSGRSYSDITGGAAPLVARTRFVRAALQTAACW
jgi:hypothetical protein